MKTNIKKFIPWVILVLILGGLSTWYFLGRRITDEQITTYQQIITDANTQFDAREYSTAIEKYYYAVDIIPSRVEAYEGIVDILLLKNRTKDASEIIEKSARKLSGFDKSTLLLKLGSKYFDDSQYDKALEIYLDGLAIGVNNPELELSIGKTYLKKGKISDANSYLSRQIYEDDNLYESVLVRSYILSVKDVSEAKSTLQSVTPSDSWKPFFEELSVVLDSLNEDEKYNATKLARVFINNGYPSLAITVLEPISDDIAEYLEGVYFLGRAYLDFGEYEKAITQLDRALSLGGLEEDILWTKARAYFLMNDLDNSLASYSKAILYGGEKVPVDLVSEYLDLLLENNQTLAAEELVSKLSNYINEPYIKIYAVKVNRSLNDTKKVDYYLGLLSKMNLSEQEKKEYLYLNAENILAKGNFDSVKDVLSELVKLDRFNPHYYMLSGQLEYNLGNKEGAVEFLKKAIEYDLSNEVSESANKLLSQID